MRLEGESVKVSLDEKPILEMADETSSRRGCISLQHNQGVVEFRNVLLRPIGSRKLKLGENWEEDWVKGEKEAGGLKVDASASGLHLQGGLGKVQSKESFGDFWLQAKYTLAKPEVNGIFFRCIEDSMLDGYECQVNHAINDNDPLSPKDAGAGAIFRRKPAWIVVGDGTKPTHISLLASGKQMVTWVNGIMTTDFTDDRPADLNPRKGTRVEADPSHCKVTIPPPMQPSTRSRSRRCDSSKHIPCLSRCFLPSPRKLSNGFSSSFSLGGHEL